MSNESENRRLYRGLAMTALGVACFGVGLDIFAGAEGKALLPGLMIGAVAGFLAVMYEFDVRRPYTQNG